MKFNPEGIVWRFRSSRRATREVIFCLVSLILLMVVSCQSADEEPSAAEQGEPSTEGVVETDNGEPSDLADSPESPESPDSPDSQSPFVQAAVLSPEEGWEVSAHSHSFVLDANGNNDACARCHSAAQWMPGPDDIPESCLTCKFDVDVPPPLIPEAEWEHIGCNICHRMDDGEPEPEYAWLDIAVIEEYIDLDSPTELCRKCHETADLSEHKPSVNIADEHAELTCTECHDAHATTVTCVDSGCHEDLLTATEPIAGHDEEHSIVSCAACHDSAGLLVGPTKDSETWVTLISLTLDGEEIEVPHSSHAFQVEAACDRCHFSSNPWGLSEDVSSGS